LIVRRIDEFCRTINDHNRAWEYWFTNAGVEPYSVVYEELDRDPIGATLNVLDFLGLERPPIEALQVRTRRQADDLNAPSTSSRMISHSRRSA
jgi:LPS sulfotransferase NodH